MLHFLKENICKTGWIVLLRVFLSWNSNVLHIFLKRVPSLHMHFFSILKRRRSLVQDFCVYFDSLGVIMRLFVNLKQPNVFLKMKIIKKNFVMALSCALWANRSKSSYKLSMAVMFKMILNKLNHTILLATWSATVLFIITVWIYQKPFCRNKNTKILN